MRVEGWLKRVVGELRLHTDRPIVVRTKPRRAAHTPLSADLRDCWALVTFMSNSAVEAVLAGVPVFCTGTCAASRMGLSDLARIESPAYPGGRAQWAWNLAANQWTLDEMRAGEAWKVLNAEI